jgi:hypothetical protein
VQFQVENCFILTIQNFVQRKWWFKEFRIGLQSVQGVVLFGATDVDSIILYICGDWTIILTC